MSRIAKWIAGISIGLILCLAAAWWYSVHIYTNKDLVYADALIDQFHRQGNAEEAEKICQLFPVCDEQAREYWASMLAALHQRAGKFVMVAKAERHAYFEPSSVQASYVSTFEKATVQEKFAFKVIGEQFLIVDYKAYIAGQRIQPASATQKVSGE